MFRFKAITFLVIVAAMVLAACQPAAAPVAEEEFAVTEVEAPAATEPPEAIAPDEPDPAATDEPASVSDPTEAPIDESASSAPVAGSAEVVEITNENFDEEVLQSPVPVLIHFWAEWMGPSRAIKPAVEEIANEYAGRVKVGEVNVDDYPDLAEQFGVQVLPTFVLITDGSEQARIEGETSKEEIIGMLNQ